MPAEPCRGAARRFGEASRGCIQGAACVSQIIDTACGPVEIQQAGSGGHVLLGHDLVVLAEITQLLTMTHQP